MQNGNSSDVATPARQGGARRFHLKDNHELLHLFDLVDAGKFEVFSNDYFVVGEDELSFQGKHLKSENFRSIIGRDVRE